MSTACWPSLLRYSARRRALHSMHPACPSSRHLCVHPASRPHTPEPPTSKAWAARCPAPTFTVRTRLAPRSLDFLRAAFRYRVVKLPGPDVAQGKVVYLVSREGGGRSPGGSAAGVAKAAQVVCLATLGAPGAGLQGRRGCRGGERGGGGRPGCGGCSPGLRRRLLPTPRYTPCPPCAPSQTNHRAWCDFFVDM